MGVPPREINWVDKKHVKLAPKETMSFVSPGPSIFPEAKPIETLSSRVNKTHCFQRGQSLSVMLYLQFKTRKKKIAKKSFDLRRLAHKAAVSREHGLITCESKVHVVVFLGSW